MFRCIIIMLSISCLFAQVETLKKDIYLWQYQRQGVAKLHSLLEHENHNIRLLSVKALGQIQNPNSIGNIAKCLKDSDQNVRMHAAFALGQMWNEASELFLLQALETEKSLAVVNIIIEALGKVGTEKTIKKFIEMFSQKKSPHTEAIAYSCGLLTYRGAHNDSLIRQLIASSLRSSAKARGHISYALMRAKEPRTANHLLQLLYDKNPYCRMNAARGIGYIKNPKTLAHLYVAMNDKDMRVAVNALNALRSFSSVDVTKIVPLVHHKNHHISLTTIGVIGDLKLDAHQQLLKIFPESDGIKKGQILVALAKIKPQACIQQIASLEKPSVLLRAKIAEALGFIDNKASVTKLRQMLTTKNNYILQMVVASLGKISCDDTTEDIVASLKSRDMAVITYAAEALTNKKALSTMPHLIEIYQQLSTPDDIEAMQAIINAVGKMTDSSHKKSIDFLQQVATDSHPLLSTMAREYLTKLKVTIPPSTNTPKVPKVLFTYEEICNLPDFTVEVVTNKGKFVIRPSVDEAPIAVYNFYQLIKKKFYHNLTFHRVVSNFVVQGGDPRGDGWGGPGYNIPCEYNMLRYKRGMVGMPLAGKDTGGCQLFITHSPQPHLNGKYTIFGEVINGMDVVDLIHTGDTIREMNIIVHKQQNKTK
ncbi:HEAT repeat domain-containing protein [Candidatus Uabimicrobium amorphum]|uniref:peptidylprolyl isomerase n=1 Tax=Uabimicrobium amorphum TaxID=2596890 RepID=A0A5S9INB9_UABAM|nr:HEAT repeat domain-containing protein [Candidatus Uabimicrobium amorphum]BBM84884.1 peptidyl-prolyl cis-trans isomerase [Candidatus Uabimicrobium amorphum]